MFPYILLQLLFGDVFIQGLVQFVVVICIVVTNVYSMFITVVYIIYLMFSLVFLRFRLRRSSLLIWMATEKCW